jgi:AcrR family transcriptional regulator
MSGDDPLETKQQIMEATYRALVRCGYADLSITAIGEEFEKCSSLVYYHYDSKDDLLLSFLDFVLEEFTALLEEGDEECPKARLYHLIDVALPPDPDRDELEFHRVLTELRVQSVRDPAYREKFRALDTEIVDTVATELRAGIDRGQFALADPDRTAEHLVALLMHGLTVRVTSGRNGTVETVRALAEDRLAAVSVEGPEESAPGGDGTETEGLGTDPVDDR